MSLHDRRHRLVKECKLCSVASTDYSYKVFRLIIDRSNIFAASERYGGGGELVLNGYFKIEAFRK